MGSKSKGGNRNNAAAYGYQSSGGGGNATYGGNTMTQDAANAKYQADLAAWRAPTATGTGTAGMDIGTTVSEAPTDFAGSGHLGVPTTQWNASGLGGGGPALPAMGVLPTAPVAVGRTALARAMTPASSTYYNQGGGGTAGGRAASAGYSSSSSRSRGTGLH